MILLLTSLFSFLASPIHWIIILLTLAMFTKKVGRKKTLLIISFVLAVAFSNPLLYKQFAKSWEVAPVQEDALQKRYDVAIVLANEVDYLADNSFSNYENIPTELIKAYELYEKDKVKKVLFSGNSRNLFKPDRPDAEILRDVFLSIDVPGRKILTETTSRNLHENAVFSKVMVDTLYKESNHLLIVPAIKAKRAQACFYQERMNVDVYPVNQTSQSSNMKFYEFVIPDQDIFAKWQELIQEVGGFYIYSLLGYV